MGRVVIVAYKPKPGKSDELKELMKVHVAILRSEGLATNRNAVLMESDEGTVIEVFEWQSAEAIQAAHTNHRIQQMWKEYEGVCEYVPLASVRESNQLFAEFSPLED